jgi:hypothetical protein
LLAIYSPFKNCSIRATHSQPTVKSTCSICCSFLYDIGTVTVATATTDSCIVLFQAHNCIILWSATDFQKNGVKFYFPLQIQKLIKFLFSLHVLNPQGKVLFISTAVEKIKFFFTPSSYSRTLESKAKTKSI